MCQATSCCGSCSGQTPSLGTLRARGQSASPTTGPSGTRSGSASWPAKPPMRRSWTRRRPLWWWSHPERRAMRAPRRLRPRRSSPRCGCHRPILPGSRILPSRRIQPRPPRQRRRPQPQWAPSTQPPTWTSSATRAMRRPTAHPPPALAATAPPRSRPPRGRGPLCASACGAAGRATRQSPRRSCAASSWTALSPSTCRRWFTAGTLPGLWSRCWHVWASSSGDCNCERSFALPPPLEQALAQRECCAVLLGSVCVRCRFQRWHLLTQQPPPPHAPPIATHTRRC
mmetsp:Transcript_19196/g.73462  ORF Transcript_19196/g.73462 Transcript_19196/m.73462 type:complete len:285 (-) Transcript_19196:1239-2093(-)